MLLGDQHANCRLANNPAMTDHYEQASLAERERLSGENGDLGGRIEYSGYALKRMAPELVVSKQKLPQAEGSCIVRLNREDGKQNLGFSSRPFVLCGPRVRKPLKVEMLYERRNGNFVLQITWHSNYCLPFGQDRMVPIYLATRAVRQQSQTIRFRTAAEMLETFGMHKGGKEYRRPVAGFERIFEPRSSSQLTRSADEPKWFSGPVSVSLAKPKSGTAETPSNALCQISLKTWSCSVMNSTGRLQPIPFRPILTAVNSWRARRPYWICSCGCRTAVS